MDEKRHLYAEINLSYFKQGYDLRDCIKKTPNGEILVIESLKNHQKLITSAIDQLGGIIEIISKYPQADINIDGDSSFLSIHGDADVIQELIVKGLVYVDKFIEE